MSVVASVVIDVEDFVLGEVLAGSTPRIELTQFVPGDVSGDDLGEELGISGQALSRRLQRGHQSILTNLLSDLAPPVMYHRNYCVECNWSTSTETHDRQEVARRAIEHFLETNHSIDFEPVPELDNIPTGDGH